MMQVNPAPLQCPCFGAHFQEVFLYEAPPEGEIRFPFSASANYRREVSQCRLCGHFVSQHEMDTTALYNEDYVSSTYRDAEGIRRTFDRITALDPAQSDNAGRVRRILDFAASHFAATVAGAGPPAILDVGSGLCVFLHRMKEAGWNCTALDPDARAVAHARDYVGVNAICADFMSAQEIGRFDVVTFNKVLEHVEDPVAMLAKSRGNLRDGGFVYVELPDGEEAMQDGAGREEFFIDHLHVFSIASVALLAARAGFTVRTLERLREPSSKYTLRAFLYPKS